jgi:hypothetical protein
MNPLLYGQNTEECIVAISQLNDQTMRIFKRIGESVEHRDVDFFPFFFLSQPDLLDRFPKPHWLKELSGINYYRSIAAFHSWSEMWEAVHYILKRHNNASAARADSYTDVPELLLNSGPVRQFFLQSGITLFKGMAFRDIRRMQIDLQFGQPLPRERKKRLGRSLRVLTLTTGDGQEFSLDASREDEASILKSFVELVDRIDPDIIEGHELMTRQIPFLVKRAEELNIELTLGRNGTPLRSANFRTTPGPFENSSAQYEIFGRHLVDLGAVADSFAGSRRNLHNHSLRYLAKRFDVPPEMDFAAPKEIEAWWMDDPRRLKEYSRRRARLVQRLSDVLLEPHVDLARMCPFNLSTLIAINAPLRIESIMVREYLRQRHSIPQPSPLAQPIGSMAEAFQKGLFKNVLQAEMESLRRSVLLAQKTLAASDTLGLLPQIVGELEALILSGGEKRPDGNTVRQWAARSLLNHICDYLGSVKGIYNDPGTTRHIEEESRTLSMKIVQQLERFNAPVLHMDGENIFFTLPDNILGEKNERLFIDRLNENLAAPVKITLTGRYKAMLCHKRKSYALLDPADNVLLSGGSLIPRAPEHFLQQFALQCIGCILTEDFSRLHHLYTSYYTIITQHKWTPRDFCRTETAKENFEDYEKEVTSNLRTPSPAMEAAGRAKTYVAQGDELWYYVAGSHPDVKILENSTLAEDWNPGMPNENTAYYLSRLREGAAHYREFFEPAAFDQIFSVDDLFGYSPPAGILRKPSKEGILGENQPSAQEELGIWLADKE